MPSQARARPTPNPREHRVLGAWHCAQGQAVAAGDVVPASRAVASRIGIPSPAANGFICSATGRGRCAKDRTCHLLWHTGGRFPFPSLPPSFLLTTPWPPRQYLTGPAGAGGAAAGQVYVCRGHYLPRCTWHSQRCKGRGCSRVRFWAVEKVASASSRSCPLLLILTSALLMARPAGSSGVGISTASTQRRLAICSG